MTNGTQRATTRAPLRIALLIGIPVAAAATAWLATRAPGSDASSVDHSQHGVARAGDTARPVMLTADQARRIGITYAVAEATLLEREIRTVGQVTYDETRVASVSLRIDGWVEALYVNFTGQAVIHGTPMLAIHSPMLVTAQEELLLARNLAASVSGGDADARRGAESLLESARRRLAFWDVPPAEIERIERTGEVQRTMVLRAPTSGFVVEKNVFQGQRVMAGDPLYRVADLGTVWVEGEVFERDLPAIRLGQAITADLDAMPGRPRKGRIAYIYPTLNADTRTSRVRVELPNPGNQLKPGMYATLRWSGRGTASAITVPRSAVIATGERNLVFLKRADGMLEPRPVTVGSATPDRIEILAGLAAGDSVVASATFLLDAESNLGALFGGMGDMPGMDMTAPASPATKTEKPDAHTSH